MFYTENLTTQVLFPGNPWDFKPTAVITARIRGDKEDRQAFYQSPDTKHCFYTGIEPLNPNLRPGKENPPHKIHAFTADYDVKIPKERVAEAIASMRIKPSYTERSLGGNVRLVWPLSQPLLVDDYSFCVFVLESAIKWLQLDLLPALDEGAFTTVGRLLCNGCEWENTGHPSIPLPALQTFFVDCGKQFRFRPANETDIPMEIVEKACREKFKMDWPGDFAPESQGPSFWVPESTSPLSAIIKPTGIFTFSAHATKNFYTWTDILGADFVRNFTQDSVSKATADVWWDSKRFWRRIYGIYCSSGMEETMNFMRVECNLSSKPEKGGVSPTDIALNHIYNQNRIKAAVPFTFRPAGLITFMGDRMLNTYTRKPVPPAAGEQVWGPQGVFPFLSTFLENLFDPKEQLMRMLAWYQYYYRAAFEETPLPGQNIFFMGHAGIGKTFLNRQIIGLSVGGFVDASDYLVNGATFNSHLMFSPHWCLDDDTPSNSPIAQAKLHAMFKKTAANQQFLSNQKFEVAGMCEWMGRIGCSTNMDFVSTRVVGPLDDSSIDKTCLFRCSTVKFKFPGRIELGKLVTAELPFFLRWLLDWKVPDEIERDPRYGYVSYQEPTLLDRTHQTNPAAPFKELLIETLYNWFVSNQDSIDWRGTVSQLVKMMSSDPLNESIMRSIRMDSVSRYLEQIQKEGLFKCSTETGAMNTRIWVFNKPEGFTPATPTSMPTPQYMPPTVEKFI